MAKSKRKRTRPARTSKPLALSLCMIVKDEEAMLGDCLASVRGLASQLIVVDTRARFHAGTTLYVEATRV